MIEKKRLGAGVLAALFVLVALFSVAFIAVEAEHDCTGEDCPICRQMAVCANALKFGLVLAVFVPAGPVAAAGSFAVRLADAVCLCLTLITLKVKLSN
ncbi:MAG: hypothetical protein K6E38_07500 [Fretibacterium sp.]|nr:hypothetical protein [Fretibacterium sp.]